MCPNNPDGQHRPSTFTHTRADGSTETRTECSSCGMSL